MFRVEVSWNLEESDIELVCREFGVDEPTAKEVQKFLNTRLGLSEQNVVVKVREV